MKSKNISYLPAADHLRGFASILILVYHGVPMIANKLAFGENVPPNYWARAGSPLSSIIIEGHTAVALFMVLSGFILTYGSIERDRDINYKSFLYNRILRIFPLFIFLIICGSYLYPENFNFIGMIQSIFLFSSLPGALNIQSFSSMFWSISVEFTFYLVFPFLFLFLKKEGFMKLLQLLILMIIIRVIAFLLGANIRDVSYWTIIGRMDQFIIGMIAAFVYVKWNINRSLWYYILFASIFLIIGMLYLFNIFGGWPIQAFWKILWPTIEGIVWSLLLISYVKLFNTNNNFIQKFLAKIGELSYSIYLTHYIVLTVLVHRGWYFSFEFLSPLKNGILTSVLVLFPLVLATSALIYSSIEKPFLQLRDRY
ncbi:acyltransferase family protein [Paenibacillus enshidis]|uniref:Acyltransferase family protein n=1 Tax=Paenibacillus enshidis TaxID=1458439 RepID=A0ABV5AR28_9BACL